MPFDPTALGDTGGTALVVLLLVALVVAGRRLRVRRRRRPRAGTGRTPLVGDIWYADVPFADGTGSKDRPVLVLRVDGRTCEVARFTSKDRSGDRHHVLLPPGFPGLSRASWIDLRPRTLPVRALRRRSGRPGPALVHWYRDTTAQRARGDAAS